MLHFKGFAMMNLLLHTYCFCSHNQSLVELEYVIVATSPFFKEQCWNKGRSSTAVVEDLRPMATAEGLICSFLIFFQNGG